jgi:hypothetical protein
MMIRRALPYDLEAINKLLIQVLTVHHNGRPDLFKAGTKKYTDEELLAYALELYAMMDDFEIATHRIPADGTYSYETIRGMSVIEVDFEENRELLLSILG